MFLLIFWYSLETENWLVWEFREFYLWFNTVRNQIIHFCNNQRVTFLFWYVLKTEIYLCEKSDNLTCVWINVRIEDVFKWRFIRQISEENIWIEVFGGRNFRGVSNFFILSGKSIDFVSPLFYSLSLSPSHLSPSLTSLPSLPFPSIPGLNSLHSHLFFPITPSHLLTYYHPQPTLPSPPYLIINIHLN